VQGFNSSPIKFASAKEAFLVTCSCPVHVGPSPKMPVSPPPAPSPESEPESQPCVLSRYKNRNDPQNPVSRTFVGSARYQKRQLSTKWLWLRFWWGQRQRVCTERKQIYSISLSKNQIRKQILKARIPIHPDTYFTNICYVHLIFVIPFLLVTIQSYDTFQLRVTFYKWQIVYWQESKIHMKWIKFHT